MADKDKDKREKSDSGSKEEEIAKKFSSYFFDPKRLLQPALQVPLRKGAEGLAKYFRKSLPSDHPLRGDLVEFAGYVAAAVLEYPGSTILRVIGEFLAAFMQVFCGGEGEDDGRVGKKASTALPPDAELLKKLALLDAGFAKNVARVLLQAQPTAKELEAAGVTMDDYITSQDEILTKLTEVWTRQKNLILYGPEKKPEPPKEPGVPLSQRFFEATDRFSDALAERMEPGNRELERKIQEQAERNRQLRERLKREDAARKPIGGRFIRGLSRALFGFPKQP